MTTTATSTRGPDLGAALDRVYRAVFRVRRVCTDGWDYDSAISTEVIANELGFDRKRVMVLPPTLEAVLGNFQVDAGWAHWHKQQRLGTLLRVRLKAGADPADLEVLREALGVEREDERLADVAEQIDERNEQTRRWWVEESQRLQAIQVSNAREAGRHAALREAFELTGDERFAGLLQTEGAAAEGVENRGRD